jgi:hypothetical protein
MERQLDKSTKPENNQGHLKFSKFDIFPKTLTAPSPTTTHLMACILALPDSDFHLALDEAKHLISHGPNRGKLLQSIKFVKNEDDTFLQSRNVGWVQVKASGPQSKYAILMPIPILWNWREGGWSWNEVELA